MTQKEKVLNYLAKGNRLTNAQARSKFNVRYLGAIVRDLRAEGNPVYLNTRANGKSHYRLGTPNQRMVAAAYAVMGSEAFNG